LKIDLQNNKMERLVEKYSFENIPSEKKGLGKFNRSATPGKWKENFSKKEQTLMDEIMGKTLKRLGYSN